MEINDERFMQLALKQAHKAQQCGEIPVGAILIKDNAIISHAHNQTITTTDPSAHAEIVALRVAARALNNYRLNNTTLYVTLEPCAMCLGALIHARIARLVFGAYDEKSGVCGSCLDLTHASCFNHTMRITGGICQSACAALLSDFFRQKR